MAEAALLPAYLVVGVDQLKRKTVLKRLKSRLEPGLEAFNLDERTAGPDLDAGELICALNTLPVGQGFRLVIIHDAGGMAKAVSEAIVRYLSDPNSLCVLCLEAEVLAKNTRLYRAVAAVGKQAVITCDAISARNLPNYVVRLARSIGITIDMAAAQELVGRVGEDTTLIERTLRSLAEQSARTTISIADVEAQVVRTADVRPWEFLDKVCAGDARRALELYRHMQKPSHIALVSLLTRRVRELICARSLIDRGQQKQIASELGRQEWQVRSVIQSAHRYSPESLARCLRACALCERELKSGADEETAFIELVLVVAQGGQ